MLSLACVAVVLTLYARPPLWQRDYNAFLESLRHMTLRGKIPSRSELRQKYRQDESKPITDGAGGFVDLAPSEDTLQYFANEFYADQNVRWKIRVLYAYRKTIEEELYNEFAPTLQSGAQFSIVPYPPGVNSVPNAAQFMATRILWLEVNQSKGSLLTEFTTGCEYIVEGRIEDARHTTMLLFSGVNAVYYLETEQPTVNRGDILYVVCISNARITPL